MIRLLLVLVWLLPALAGAVTLGFDAPTTNTDGSPLTDLEAFVLYFRPLGGATWQVVGQVDKQSRLIEVVNPSPGDYALRAVNVFAVESDNSNLLNAKKPNNPRITSVTK